jgi:branched-chain amino acid transport system permease protein
MRLGRNFGWLIVIVVAFLIPLLLHDSQYFLSVFVMCLINVLLTSSLRSTASTGQVSLGIMAFMGIGAFTSALLMMKLSFPIWAALPLAGLAAMAVAAVIGFPFVRVTGLYFAMVTLFFCEVIRLILTQWRTMTGGSTGIVNIPSVGTISVLGLNINFSHILPYSYFALFVTVVSLLILYRIDRSHLGTHFASIGQDESVAESIGINVIWFKVFSFCIGCFFAGVAGSLYAHFLTVLYPDVFSIFPSIYILIYMVAGGRKSFIGPILGAIILTVIPELFLSLKTYQPFIYVAFLYIVLYSMPGGLVTLPGIIGARFATMRQARLRND